MNLRAALWRIVLHEDVNFLLTNRLPRRWLTLAVRPISRSRHPLVRGIAMGLWRMFSDLDLSDARETRFESLHDCFVRELKAGARPIASDARVLVSPCDGIVGAHGRIEGDTVFQAKGFPYGLAELLADSALATRFGGGTFVTLRLTSSMYHRFHAPADATVRRLRYISGDTWNVNPIALRRVERLFCRNERATVELELAANGDTLLLVPVAAILVAGMRFTFADAHLHLRYRGPNLIPCNATLRRGEQMGWFEHGSTILVFTPPGYRLCEHIAEGAHLRMGEPLLRLPSLRHG